MENTGSILALALTALAVTYFGYRISKERARRREMVSLLGEEDAGLVQSLENIVHKGKLSPVAN